MLKEFNLFDRDSYTKRLRLLRAMFGETQEAFAARLDIPFKRWNEYERGYPMPRETAWMIRQKIAPGIIEWIWFGDESHISDSFRKQLRAVERAEKERAEAKAKELRARSDDARAALRKVRKTDQGSNAAKR